jgi:hypothetical protein
LKKKHKVHLETQKTENIQGNTEQKKQHKTYHNTQLQTILQATSVKQHFTDTKIDMKTSET